MPLTTGTFSYPLDDPPHASLTPLTGNLTGADSINPHFSKLLTGSRVSDTLRHP